MHEEAAPTQLCVGDANDVAYNIADTEKGIPKGCLQVWARQAQVT